MKLVTLLFMLFTSIELFSQDSQKNPGYTLKFCEQKTTRLTVYPGAASICFPDTLYHWTSQKYLDFKINNAKDSNFLPFPKEPKTKFNLGLWLARTPVSSHGYGNVSIRIKLNADVEYQYIPATKKEDTNCSKLAQDFDLKRTVFYRGWTTRTHWSVKLPNPGEGGYLSEFIICDQEVVESWSYGTVQHHKEMKDEVNWIRSNDISELTGFMTGINPFKLTNIDGRLFGYLYFTEKLKKIEQALAQTPGKVYCSPSTDADCEKRHFETKLPIYYINHLSSI